MGILVAACIKYDDWLKDFSTWSIYLGLAMTVPWANRLRPTSKTDLVTQVQYTAINKSSAITELDIYAHGADTNVDFNADSIADILPKDDAQPLTPLAGVMDTDGYIVFNVCQLGKATGILAAVAQFTGVPVYANTGDFNSMLAIPNGMWIMTSPDGTFTQGTAPPAFPDPAGSTYLMSP